MGTTIRRQPVNFDIPASPNYKFLNITNFRGLDVSSNPFELATNTASDCLNVYVDETNTLTTRPRLEKKLATPIDGEHIATYTLHNGYLLHYNKNVRDDDTNEIIGKQVEMRLLQDGKLNPKPVSGEIPAEKCQYFEQGDKIYLLDGSRYLVISENILSNVEGYVPTTAVVDLKNERRSVEQINLLSNEYKEVYLWDGYSAKDLPKNANALNTYYKQIDIESGLQIWEYYDDGSAIVWDGSTFYYKADITKENKTKICTLPSWNYTKIAWASSRDVTHKMFAYLYTTEKVVKFYEFNGNEWVETVRYLNSALLNERDSVSWHGLRFTLDKNIISFQFYSDTWSLCKYIEESSRYEDVSDRGFIEVSISNNNEIFGLNRDKLWYFNDFTKSTEPELLLELPQTSDPTISVGCSANGNVCWVYTPYRAHIIQKTDSVFDKEHVTTFDFKKNELVRDMHSTSDGNIMWYTDSDSTTLFLKTKSDEEFYKTYLPTPLVEWMTPNKYLVTMNRIYEWNSIGEVVDTITITDNIDWENKRNRLFKSNLVTRFDNNYWLAFNNEYYRSANNDPTYFPITEYNELGDSNEEITGFNLANDTTLIAYKKNKIYLIQPFTSSLDTTEYTITESKNTVGNTAIGAPIVTTLTEIPLQINNDGVYGLSQLANVSATERIADLMSEPINERWLNIDDKLITKAQTLNRLYWTYIILPDSAHEKTMIYLLDNRSNSWYYWELPIVVSNSFVKDNRAEFVDTAGNIYYLTTEDIVNKAFETLVTEYYDDGNKLIPWYWQSQILPLGTMNYSKRLVNTTFVLTDTDNIDGYGLNYSFKVFRKLASSTPEKEITGDLTLVRSTTKKTNISKFGFIQLKLSNITEKSQGTEPEKAFRNNKLRLVGLGLKYVLLEGLIR
jgi:hypothetical protein